MRVFQSTSTSYFLVASICLQYLMSMAIAFQMVPPTFSHQDTYRFSNSLTNRIVQEGTQTRVRSIHNSAASHRTSLVRMNLISKSEIDEIESDAIRAAENWDVSVTPFYSPENAKLISDRLSSRADLGFIQVGGLPSSLRTRFVMSNPDLELDPISAQSEYCVLLCVDHVDTAPLRRQSPWPHVFTQIGVDLENVGDVVVEDNNAYVVVVPKVAKQCCRLIPKELRGVGLTVSVVQPGEYFPFDGMQQDMHLGKLDKRALKYK